MASSSIQTSQYDSINSGEKSTVIEKTDIEWNEESQITSIPLKNVSGATSYREGPTKEDVIKLVFAGSEMRKCGDVVIKNSDNIHVGNVTYITGSVNINHIVTSVHQKTDIQQTFVKTESVDTLNVVPRSSWLAKPAVSMKVMKAPADLVVICHTATEKSETMSGNMDLIRLMQKYHIESKHWEDIGYNFMVGCDDHVYEGRGWNVVGRHTLGFNDRSVGVGFIGCFLSELPPPGALKACQALLEMGVRMGAITPNYKLVGHCQCRPTKSPGRVLFEEISSWPHWTNVLWEPRQNSVETGTLDDGVVLEL